MYRDSRKSLNLSLFTSVTLVIPTSIACLKAFMDLSKLNPRFQQFAGNGEPVILIPEKEVPPGTKIR
jgi:hypothetical protein